MFCRFRHLNSNEHNVPLNYGKNLPIRHNSINIIKATSNKFVVGENLTTRFHELSENIANMLLYELLLLLLKLSKKF